DTGVYSAYTDMYDSRYNDLWSYSGGAWTELIESGSFTQRLDGAAVWDAATRSILGFGGQYWNVTNIYLDSIFLYSNSTNSWTEYTEVGPTARFDHALAWNPTARELYMFGGWMHSSLGDELWLLEHINEQYDFGPYHYHFSSYHFSPCHYHVNPCHYHVSPCHYHVSPCRYHFSPCHYHFSPRHFHYHNITNINDPLRRLVPRIQLPVQHR
ncbi:rngB, partial [Symbiodinium natans]